MAHFAKIDENNIVEQVIVISNDDCLDENGNESEQVGAAFCKSLVPGTWIQTSYSHRIRKNFAGIGYTYSVEKDAFIAPKPNIPGKTFVLDETTCRWVEQTES